MSIRIEESEEKLHLLKRGSDFYLPFLALGP